MFKSTYTAEPSSLERISQGSGLFDRLGLNTPQNRMENALWNAFNRSNYVQSTSAFSTYKI